MSGKEDLLAWCEAHDKRWQEIIKEHSKGFKKTPVAVQPMPIPDFKIFIDDVQPASQYIKTRLKELEMEKRGVVTDDEKTKTAEQDKKCPKCGSTMNEHNYCANCGTEPFEKQPDGES